MRISFIIPFINWTGGIRIVFEYAERLHQRGHKVTIYFPMVPYLFADRLYTLRGLRRWVGDLVLNLRRRTHQKWFRLSAPLMMVPWISDHFVSDGDAVIATAWPTAYSVYRLSRSKGTKFYFVQQYEIWSGPQGAVDGSYRLPLHKIAAASWLSRLITERFGEPVLDTIIQGVNFDLFYPDGRSPDRTGRVLMQYSPLEWKGIADGLRAWEIVQQRCPWARLVMFGLKRGPDVPPNVEFHEDPPQEELRRIYSSCDIFVSTSWIEGCQLPPMEAMACQCAVVATNVGGVPDYTIPGQTALVVEPRDINAMAEAIIRLLQNDDERRRIAEAGCRYIKQFTWDKAVERFEIVLERGISLS
jgi:glycosyltransferase involved in cell wall biosynthesis